MRAGGFANKLRFTLAVVLTLLTLVVGVLWVGSYKRHSIDLFSGPAAEEGFVSARVFFPTDSPGFSERHGWGLYRSANDTGSFSLQSEDGRLVIYVEDFSADMTTQIPDKSWLGFSYTEHLWLLAPCSRLTDPKINSRSCCITREAMIPFWMLLVLFGAFPAWLWLNGPLRRRRRQRRGQCLACGYDLSHSPGRCPECGAEAKAVG